MAVSESHWGIKDGALGSNVKVAVGESHWGIKGGKLGSGTKRAALSQRVIEFLFSVSARIPACSVMVINFLFSVSA